MVKKRKIKESKNRIARGFARLKKKYYTPKVRRALKKTGRGLANLEHGSNSLVSGSDPYGINGDYFDSWDSNQFGASPRREHHRERVVYARPIRRKKTKGTTRIIRRKYGGAVRRRVSRPRQQKRDRFESNYSLGHDPRPSRDNIFGVGANYWDNN